MAKKIKYIYILSQKYSGSTLLSFLLGSHPEVSTIGERRKFYTKSLYSGDSLNSTCSCGKLFTECDHWNKIKTQFLNRVSGEDLSTNVTEFQVHSNKQISHLALKGMQFCAYHNIPYSLWPYSKRFKQLCDANLALVEEILKIDNKTVFLDSSKIINQALLLSTIPELDFYVIWLSRDPRAQVYSSMKYNPWTVEESATRWTEKMKMNQKILQKGKIRFLPLQYETLCRQPESEMRRLFEFVELAPEGFTLDFRAKTQHLMGNASMRLGNDQKIEERKDWQEKLSSTDIEKIEQLTKDFRNFYAPSPL